MGLLVDEARNFRHPWLREPGHVFRPRIEPRLDYLIGEFVLRFSHYRDDVREPSRGRDTLLTLWAAVLQRVPLLIGPNGPDEREWLRRPSVLPSGNDLIPLRHAAVRFYHRVENWQRQLGTPLLDGWTLCWWINGTTAELMRAVDRGDDLRAVDLRRKPRWRREFYTDATGRLGQYGSVSNPDLHNYVLDLLGYRNGLQLLRSSPATSSSVSRRGARDAGEGWEMTAPGLWKMAA